MASRRVITGTDDRGRPVTEWQPIGDGLGSAPAFGFMEPAYSTAAERRKATPEELAAAAARDGAPGYLAPIRKPPTRLVTTPELMQASRMRATQRLQEVLAAARATPTQQEWNGHGPRATESEEGIMVDEPTPAPEDVIHTISTASPLTVLSDAAAIAHEKLEAVRDAEQAWEIARKALEDAMAECFDVIGSPATPAVVVSEPETLAELPKPPPTALRQPGHHDSHAGQTAERAERAARVTEAVARHGGDRSAAAAELGMRPNAVAMVMKHAVRRAEATA